jgi:hypothetical protein
MRTSDSASQAAEASIANTAKKIAARRRNGTASVTATADVRAAKA